ncbi:MAG: peptidylprolyl isomerase [Oscillibacter sp.]|nr:peptidylprolyl isomerase [Oscillibacter sp.]
MKKKLSGLLALLLCLTCLAGCGSKSGKTKAGLYYDATGISPDAVLLTVDGWDVTADRYLYWLTYNCDYITNYYKQAGKTVDWNESHSGQTLADYVKSQALSTTALYAEVESWAKKYGCEISDEDLSGIDTQWDAMVRQYGGEDAYTAELAYMGIDKASAQLISADYYLYNHLYELYSTEGSELYPAQADVDAYAQEKGYLTVDEILVSTADVADGDTAAMAEKRERADMILGKLNASSDPLTYFSTLAGTYSDDDRETYPDGFTFAPGVGTMSDAFETAAQTLEENKWSDVVESDEGFYIILRKPLDTDTVSADYFDNLLKTAADNADITYSDDYDSLDVADLCTKLADARAKLNLTAGDSSAFGTLPAATPEEGGTGDSSAAAASSAN